MGRSPSRLGLLVAGSMLVVLLVLAAAGFVQGMNSSLQTSGSPDNALIVAAGSEESVERSEISARVPGMAASSLPGLRSTLGVAHVSPEVHIQARLNRAPDNADNGKSISLALRGVTPEALLVHSHVRLTLGAWPQPGSDQILVGRLALAALGFPDSQAVLGQKVYFDNRPWTVAGILSSPGSVTDSEVWVPLSDLQVATRRDTVSCVVITLDTATLEDVQLFASKRVDLEIVAMSEKAYYDQVAAFYKPIQLMALVTAGLIGIGGLFGGLNTLYSAFATRMREFATLQTLGFSRRAVFVSLMQEALLATMAGGLLACLIGVLFLDGLTVRFAMGETGLRIDSPVLALGLLTSIALGLFGVLPPAIHCLRMPITSALKSV